MKIKSALKTYSVEFIKDFNSKLCEVYKKGDIVFIDKNLSSNLPTDISYLKLDINENSKEYNHLGSIIEQIPNKFNKTNKIIAVGGGITQDIVTFISAILFRGVEWVFFPTTLLAQGDSCIGGKASINHNGIKNRLGLYNPPNQIFIDINFTKSLSNKDITSGLGEMLHFYLVSGAEDFNFFKQNLGNLEVLIKRCLEIKKDFIETDEFDKGRRLLLNYGHTFGHAIEGATDYKYAHGIAVSKGMDIANFLSYKLGYMDKDLYHSIKKTLKTVYNSIILPDLDNFIQYLKQDKKNTSTDKLTCILSKGPGKMFIQQIDYFKLKQLLPQYI